MRYVIWDKGDYFEDNFGGDELTRYTMESAVVELPSDPIPLTFWFDNVEPVGRVVDIRLEDGDITGEIVWAPDSPISDEGVKDSNLVFSGGYRDVERAGTVIFNAALFMVAVLPRKDVPSRRDQEVI